MDVLIAEDDPVSRLKLQRTLEKWNYNVVVCEDGDQVWDYVAKPECPKLLILDWMMPGLDGVDVCRCIREQKIEPYVYIVLLTSKSGSENLVEGMDAGADDFISKPYDPNVLKVRLRAGERIITLNEKLLETRNALQIQATHDAMTGMWNRITILGQLQKEISRAQRTDKGMCVVMIDIDHFKSINDTYGHLAGDVVLEDVGSRMKSVLRPYDSIGRYGGEEFLVIIADWREFDHVNHVQRLREAIEQEQVSTINHKIRVTASFGICVTDSVDGLDSTRLIHAADEALYRAKENGRNRVEINRIVDGKTEAVTEAG